MRSIGFEWCSSAMRPILSRQPPGSVYALRSVGLAEDHPCTDRVVRRLVDEDEAAGGAVAAVLVEEERRGRAECDPPDLVELQRLGVFVAMQLVHVEPVKQVTDQRARRAGRVLDRQLGAGAQLGMVR